MLQSIARLSFYLLFSLTFVCSTALQKSATGCPATQVACESDRIGWEAITFLHGQLDDDHNGNVDLSESDEFIREELKYENGFERQSNFHAQGHDKLISVTDLWNLWTHSQVHNWTVDDVVDWLVHHVELPQYVSVFRNNAVDGKALPRLAAANNQFISGILGIKNPVHKQKLGLKAMDAVLFGAPKKLHNYMKDLALVASLVIAVGGCWFAYVQHKHSQSHLKKMMKDMDTLQSAEAALAGLQEKLQHAQLEKNYVAQEKQHLEDKMKAEVESARKAAEELLQAQEFTDEEMSRVKLLEEELAQVRTALRLAERQLQCQHAFVAPDELQQWLQLTHEIELKHYNKKKHSAELELMSAKEGCEKLRKKRQAFLGSFRVAHSNSIDDVDQQIIKARQALEEVKVDLQERLHRWQQIESLCGFTIVNNPGLNYLMNELSDNYTSGAGSMGPAPKTVSPAVEDHPSPEPQRELKSAGEFVVLKHSVPREGGLDHKVKTQPIDYKKALEAKRAKFRRQATTGSISFKNPISTVIEEKTSVVKSGSTGSLQLHQSMPPLNITETDEFEDLPPAYAAVDQASCLTQSKRSMSVPLNMMYITDRAPHKPRLRTKSFTSLKESDKLSASTETVGHVKIQKNDAVDFFNPNERDDDSAEDRTVLAPKILKNVENSIEYKKSLSLEQTKITTAVPVPLPKSCSEGALGLSETRVRVNSDSKKKGGLFKRPPVKVEEDEGSSPESTNGEEKRKKKKTLLPSFLKRDVKSKNC